MAGVESMEMHPRRHRLLTPLFGLVLAAGSHPATVFSQAADVSAKLTYSRTFKGSTPEYMAIVVDSKGSGTYEGHKLDETQKPRPIQLSSATTDRLFSMAWQLHNFQAINLESHKKVASLGEKSLELPAGRRSESGGL